jgi:hypothetical protein
LNGRTGRPAPRTPVRANDNDLICFDYEARESWILYPPRSYLGDKRILSGQTLVERPAVVG